MTNTTGTDEIHTYGSTKYRRGDDGWEERRTIRGFWHTILPQTSSIVAMLDVLHPLPDPPPVTVTINGTVWTRSGVWINQFGNKASFSLCDALGRIVELGGADQ
jgi:hypothetical protein